MIYEKTLKGTFISRPNRFIANIRVNGTEQRAHVKNTGRMKELLTPGAEVILEDYRDRMGNRKLEYSLIGVYKEGIPAPINIDSQAPNKVVEEYIRDTGLSVIDDKYDEISYLRREFKYGSSRIDFYVENNTGEKMLVEVKGVTLERSGIAYFPDAPTIRGIKHVEELIKAKAEGYDSCILFVIQMEGIRTFRPNDITHRQFGDALRKARKEGVKIVALTCEVKENSLNIVGKIEVDL